MCDKETRAFSRPAEAIGLAAIGSGVGQGTSGPPESGFGGSGARRISAGESAKLFKMINKKRNILKEIKQ